MARLVKISVIFLLSWSLWARGQEPAEGELVDELSALRLRLERLSDSMGVLEARQAELRKELDRLSIDIQQRKQKRALGGLLPDFELRPACAGPKRWRSSLRKSTPAERPCRPPANSNCSGWQRC